MRHKDTSFKDFVNGNKSKFVKNGQQLDAISNHGRISSSSAPAKVNKVMKRDKGH